MIIFKNQSGFAPAIIILIIAIVIAIGGAGYYSHISCRNGAEMVSGTFYFELSV